MKILIAGDSFAADWSVVNGVDGWPNILSESHDVTNVAQAGCGQYKILKQLKNQLLREYDAIIISHTSPYRIHTAYHPVHHDDPLHANCDFIYSDVKAHSINSMVEYFELFFDLDHAKDIHNLICAEIDRISQGHRTIHITHFAYDDLYSFKDMINFHDIHVKHPGNVNHYDQQGNMIVLDRINKRLGHV